MCCVVQVLGISNRTKPGDSEFAPRAFPACSGFVPDVFLQKCLIESIASPLFWGELFSVIITGNFTAYNFWGS